MPYDPEIHTGRLRRLSPEAYCGHAWVHWTMTMDQRKADWLDHEHHLSFRLLLLHALLRQHLLCPLYCLMPDHAHFLIGGLSPDSDQKTAVKFLRSHWNRLLRNKGEFQLQTQAYDHVLNEKESSQKAFEKMADYIIENPVRKGLVESSGDWPFLGAMVPGYPDLTTSQNDFWETFWKVYYSQLEMGAD